MQTVSLQIISRKRIKIVQPLPVQVRQTTIWRHSFHDTSMTFCKGPTQIAAIRTVGGQEIMVKLWQGKILTSHRGKFFTTRNRDTEKLSSQVFKTYLGTVLVWIQSWPCLEQEVRLQIPEVPFNLHNDGFNIAGISVFLWDLKGHWYYPPQKRDHHISTAFLLKIICICLLCM